MRADCDTPLRETVWPLPSDGPRKACSRGGPGPGQLTRRSLSRRIGESRASPSWKPGVPTAVDGSRVPGSPDHSTFDRAGQYVWHCHMLEDEDNEMMRPYRVGPH
ncbi:hypothetical protein GCM10018966_040460 [Streptomyces yanii]